MASLDRRALCELPEAVALRLIRRAAAAAGVILDARQAESALVMSRRRGARLDVRGGALWTDGEALRAGAGTFDAGDRGT
jgi:hypothetical protein